VLLTRPPLTIAGPCDLHALAMPPAFNLSQDQTLQLKSIDPRASLAVAVACLQEVFACSNPRSLAGRSRRVPAFQQCPDVSGRLVPEISLTFVSQPSGGRLEKIHENDSRQSCEPLASMILLRFRPPLLQGTSCDAAGPAHSRGNPNCSLVKDWVRNAHVAVTPPDVGLGRSIGSPNGEENFRPPHANVKFSQPPKARKTSSATRPARLSTPPAPCPA
jgi:hypothetical protein